jgi:hypothetical protein
VVMNVKGAPASGKSTMRPLQKILAGKLNLPWDEFALINCDCKPGLHAQFTRLVSIVSHPGSSFHGRRLFIGSNFGKFISLELEVSKREICALPTCDTESVAVPTVTVKAVNKNFTGFAAHLSPSRGVSHVTMGERKSGTKPQVVGSPLQKLAHYFSTCCPCTGGRPAVHTPYATARDRIVLAGASYPRRSPGACPSR